MLGPVGDRGHASRVGHLNDDDAVRTKASRKLLQNPERVIQVLKNVKHRDCVEVAIDFLKPVSDPARE
jgi:hypothetical protein